MYEHLEKIRTFFAVVEAASFTRAADNLGLSKAIVSLHVKSLEQALGVSLLVRTTRRLALTPGGQQFYQDFKVIFADIDSAVERVNTAHRSLDGELRISSTWEYGQRWLMPLIATFCQRHPQLRIGYRVGASLDDLVSNKLDVAIRLGTLRDSSLRSRKLASYRIVLVASPELAARHAPVALADTVRMPWIHNSNLPQPGRWCFRAADNTEQEIRCEAAHSANSAQIILQMALQGMGLAVLPEWLVKDDIDKGNLIELFSHWQLPIQSINAVFAERGTLQRRTRLFIDYLSEQPALI